jgi:uncharacterized protein YcbX
MQVTRIGFTALKGARHRAHPAVELAATGPAGDRVLCLVDPAADRCLRTVENPALMQVVAGWADGVLSVTVPGSGPLVGVPEPTGEQRKVDYWGRTAEVEVLGGPWADALGAHLGRDVLLARARPGEVVYGGSVTLVTTGSLALLAERLGAPAAGERFRATFEVDTGDLPAHAEDDWVGRTLALGSAEVTVRGVVPRCAVVDHDPVSGRRDRDVLRTLAGYRRGQGEVFFGVDAEVTGPGRVQTGDRVELGRD